jgi:anaerobic selenocysteine-containing dehydrogenase
MGTAPSEDDLLAIIAANARLPFEELKQAARGGRIFDTIAEVRVQPPSGEGGRLAVMPDDVAEELRTFARTPGPGAAAGSAFPLLLVGRRIRETSNTSCRSFKSARKRAPFNPLCAHPQDVSRLGLADGAECWVVSDNGRIPAIVKSDEALKPGVVSMTHGYGWLVGEEFDYRDVGSSTSLLISLDRDCEPLQAMPRMSGVPVRVEAREAVLA